MAHVLCLKMFNLKPQVRNVRNFGLHDRQKSAFQLVKYRRALKISIGSRGVARILMTGCASANCSTSAFLGRSTDDFRRILPRNFLLSNFLSWKVFTSNDFYLHVVVRRRCTDTREKFGIFDEKDKHFDDFLSKFTNIWMKIFACGAGRRRRRHS